LLLNVRLQLVLEEKDNIQEELRAIRQQLEATPQHGQQHGDLYKQLVVSVASSTGLPPVYLQSTNGHRQVSMAYALGCIPCLCAASLLLLWWWWWWWLPATTDSLHHANCFQEVQQALQSEKEHHQRMTSSLLEHAGLLSHKYGMLSDEYGELQHK
jgi:hypothetical protein